MTESAVIRSKRGVDPDDVVEGDDRGKAWASRGWEALEEVRDWRQWLQSNSVRCLTLDLTRYYSQKRGEAKNPSK
jgi:hypothetical protein